MDLFEEACQEGDLEKVKELYLENNITDGLQIASYNGHVKVVQFLVENCDGNIHANFEKLLECASQFGHLKVVQYLVEKGANIHANHNIALWWASVYSHLEVYKFLVEKGAGIYAKNNRILEWASEQGHLKLVQILVSNGANIHANDDLALRDSSENGHLEVVQFLVWKGGIQCIDKIKDPVMKKKVQEYVHLRNVYQECLTRIYFHPLLERTKSENEEKLKEINLCNFE